MKRHLPLALLLLALAALPAVVEAQQNQPPQGGPGGPPPEALSACSGKTSGTACSFSGRSGETVTGTCFSPSSDRPMACRPANSPGGQGQQGNRSPQN